jgi:hypothetical protein
MKKYSDYGIDYNYSYSAPKNEEDARKRLLAILNKPKASPKKDFIIPIISIKKEKVKAVSHDKKFILPKVKPKKQPEFKVPKVKKPKKVKAKLH